MKSKKLPKWAIPVGIAVILLVFIALRKRKPSQGKATEAGSEGLTNQSFIPVTGENVPGAGASFYPTGSSNNEGLVVSFLKEQNEANTNALREQRAEGKAQIENERSFFQTILANLGTGGGAPTSNGVPGISVAPAPEAAITPTPPPVVAPTPGPAPPPVSVPKCPSDYPDWNPKNGLPGPHSCYKYSRDKCNQPYPYKHVYQDGHYVCSPS